MWTLITMAPCSKIERTWSFLLGLAVTCMWIVDGRRIQGVVSHGTSRHIPHPYCGPCDVRACPLVSPDVCPGRVVKDQCGCCPICDVSSASSMAAGPPPQPTAQLSTGKTCDSVKCPRQQVCFLNIQNIPLCRCASVYFCRRQKRRDVCGRDGHTYKSRCYLQLVECTQNRKIRMQHKGPCRPGEVENQHGNSGQQEKHTTALESEEDNKDVPQRPRLQRKKSHDRKMSNRKDIKRKEQPKPKRTAPKVDNKKDRKRQRRKNKRGKDKKQRQRIKRRFRGLYLQD